MLGDNTCTRLTQLTAKVDHDYGHVTSIRKVYIRVNALYHPFFGRTTAQVLNLRRNDNVAGR